MAELASYVGIVPRTIQIANTALTRGVRVTLQSTGLYSLQDATARGDMVTIVSTDTSATTATAASMGGGGKVPAMAAAQCNVGDLAYAAANGQFTNVSTNAALCGRWTLGTSGANVLGEVELASVA